MKVHHLTRALEVRRTREDVFAFFADPYNLEVITPPWLDFQIVTPPEGRLAEGSRVQSRLRLHGIPFGWITRIAAWEPPSRFVDEQLEGPYLRWVHTHVFEETAQQGTIIRDHVEYAVPSGVLVERLLERQYLERIFDYRRDRLRDLLTGVVPPADSVR